MTDQPLLGCRILHVNKLYWPDVGGVETVVRQYANFAAQLGAEVTVLCTSSQASREEPTDGAVTVRRAHAVATVASMPLSLEFVKLYLQLRDRFDIIHLHEPFPLATVLEQRSRSPAKRVVTWHSDIVRQRTIKRAVTPLQSRLCQAVDLITTTSPQLPDSSSMLRPHARKIRVLPLSIDLQAMRERAAQLRPIEGLLPGGPYALYLGRFASYKGLEVLAGAIEHVAWRNFKLLVAGDGPCPTALLDAASVHPQTVQLINRRLSEDEKLALLDHCEFVVFPSTGSNEAFGIVQIEGMACGKPIINTRLDTGVPWVSEHGTSGLTVTPGDHMDLAHAITRLLDDVELRARLSLGARRRAEALFDDARAKAGLGALYLELLRGPARA